VDGLGGFVIAAAIFIRKRRSAVEGVFVIAACARGARRASVSIGCGAIVARAADEGAAAGARRGRAEGGTVKPPIVPFARIQRVVAVAAVEAIIIPTTGMHSVVAVATCANETTGSSTVVRRR